MWVYAVCVHMMCLPVFALQLISGIVCVFFVFKDQITAETVHGLLQLLLPNPSVEHKRPLINTYCAPLAICKISTLHFCIFLQCVCQCSVNPLYTNCWPILCLCWSVCVTTEQPFCYILPYKSRERYRNCEVGDNRLEVWRLLLNHLLNIISTHRSFITFKYTIWI